MDKVFCPEIDCEGVPDCSCCTPEYWKGWHRRKAREKAIEYLDEEIEELTDIIQQEQQ